MDVIATIRVEVERRRMCNCCFLLGVDNEDWVWFTAVIEAEPNMFW